MGRLVALALPGGPAFVEALRQIWADGDAVAPLDPRLPDQQRRLVLDVLAPQELIDEQGHRTTLAGGRPVDDGDALVLATSGTSGRPKGVIHTHDSIEASARATSAALAVDPERDRWLACLPLAHIGGLSVVLRSLVTGTPVEVHPGFDAAAVTAAAEDGATLVSLVTRALHQVDPLRFRRILLGGAAPPSSVPSNAVTTYGMTETGSAVVHSFHGPDAGADQRPRQQLLDGAELRIAESGEILVRGPMLFRGYRADDATTDGGPLPTPFDEHGWFATGDLGHRDATGRLVVEGRRGDVIVTGGEKVWPESVERLLNARPDVAEAAVIGRPDPEWGQRVTAVVVVADGHERPTLDELRATVKDTLPAWAAPKQIEFVAKPLPRTSLGKLRRAAL
jgi:O-succinylbenzoic acid--CoA ligase